MKEVKWRGANRTEGEGALRSAKGEEEVDRELEKEECKEGRRLREGREDAKKARRKEGGGPCRRS